MLSKKHFEAMAEHIARETKPGSKEREGAMHLAVSTAKASNPRFDEGRFRGAVEGLDKGTHTVGDSGRIKRVGGTSEVKKLSSGAKISKAEQFRDMFRKYGQDYNAAYIDKANGGGGAGDEPRDERGRWTR